MFTWIVPETISCNLFAVGMGLGWLYYALWSAKEKTHWILIAVTTVLLAMCIPIATAATTQVVSFALLIGLLFGITATAVISKVSTPEVTLVDCLQFKDAERKNFEDDVEYGFGLDEAEFVLLCELVLPIALRAERIDAYYKRFGKKQDNDGDTKN